MSILTGNWTFDILVALTGILILLVLYIKRKYSYWEQRSFKTLPNINYLFGHFKSTFTQRESIADFINRIYKTTNALFIGMYASFRPILLVRSPELIRSILVRDFPYFTDRSGHCTEYYNEEYDPLSRHLLALPGQRWKNLRSNLMPTFSSEKLNEIFSTIVDCGASLQGYLDNLVEKSDLFDIREIATNYTTNITASVASSVETEPFENLNNEFRACDRETSESNTKNSNKIFQLLRQLRNTGTVKLDDRWENVVNTDENQKIMTRDEIAANTFEFFRAGFEKSSTTLIYCMYELAKNPEIQRRVHDEIYQILKKNHGKITFEAISNMKYLEACINETLRKYPALPVINRSCVHDYIIGQANKIIEKGTKVLIPIMALHMDEKYYKDPERFDPNRFLKADLNGENFVNRPYLPFGDGPRNCIGIKMGKIQAKIGLITMLRKFRFELDDKLKNHKVQFDPTTFLITPLDKMQLKISKR